MKRVADTTETSGFERNSKKSKPNESSVFNNFTKVFPTPSTTNKAIHPKCDQMFPCVTHSNNFLNFSRYNDNSYNNNINNINRYFNNNNNQFQNRFKPNTLNNTYFKPNTSNNNNNYNNKNHTNITNNNNKADNHTLIKNDFNNNNDNNNTTNNNNANNKISSTTITTYSNKNDSNDDGAEANSRKIKDVKISPNITSQVHKFHCKLTDQIMEYFEQNKQSASVYDEKRHLQTKLYKLIREIIPDSQLFMFGSSLNGAGTNSSDLDLCLVLKNSQVEDWGLVLKTLNRVKFILSRNRICQKSNVIKAKVPIIKFKDSNSHIDCDMNVNNTVGIRNTHLLRAYSLMDTRVRPLLLGVKKWARQNGINDASQGTLSSYSLTLMVLHYLQVCPSRLLPSLQVVAPVMFNVNRPLASLGFNENLQDIINYNNNINNNYNNNNYNNITVGQLFIDFIDYFDNRFNFADDVISVRNSSKLSKREVAKHAKPESQWKFICIEEPFTGHNVSRSVYDEQMFNKIRKAFRGTNDWLRRCDGRSLIG